MAVTAGVVKRASWCLVVAAIIAWSVGTALHAPLFAASAEEGDVKAGSLIKGSLPAVYYSSADGKRYVFPNEKTYRTWYDDFTGVRIIKDTTLAAMMIGGNVTYRPGVKLVKVTTDPNVYAVASGGVLRHVVTEAVAAALYGPRWAKDVEDIPDAFFVNYTVGAPITSAADYERLAELASASTIDADQRVNISTQPKTPVPAPLPAPAPSGPMTTTQPDAPGHRTSTTGRFVRTDIVVDTDSINPSDDALNEFARIANNILVLRADTEMRFDRTYRMSYRSALESCGSCPTGQDRGGTVLTPLMNLYANVPEPEFIVFFRGDNVSLTYGGYAASYQSAHASFRNRFTSARGRTDDVYVSVSNWGHRFNICGYDRTDLRNPQHVSDVAINGECRNRPGTPCVLQSGYWQCNDAEALNAFYARPYAFAAATAVHELMHQFGSDGVYNHYGASGCTIPTSSDLNAGQAYAQICPTVFDLFVGSYHE
ncbi:MAG: hypothetical protein Q8R16_03700 [bacterium]|nr:hypothetical protein [bacterium]